MNFQELIKDKRFWAVIGVGGIAGVFMMLKTGGAASEESSAAGYGLQTAGTVGTYDSTSADIANQLGQYQTGLQTALGEYSQDQQEALKDYQQTLTDALAGLTKGTPSTPSSGTLPAGYGWFATGGKTYTAASVASKYKIPLSTLQALNPSLKISSGTQKLPKNTPIKVRSNAGPWSLSAYRQVNKR